MLRKLIFLKSSTWKRYCSDFSKENNEIFVLGVGFSFGQISTF